MNNKFNYDVFYEILSELREEFHKVGRLDDSNSKLDEIVKLIVLGYSEAVKGVKFDLKFVKNFALEKYGDDTQIAQAVRDLFESCIQDDMFKNNDGTNIFGSNPMLNIQPSENLFAQKLINEISKIDFLQLVNLGTYSDFDIFNECFGHFVRENFRNNKEDAQYMTPAEISEPIIEMVFNDIIKDGNFIERLISDESDFIVMDPTCGVGTLLIEAIKYITKIVDETELDEHTKNRIIHKIKSKGVFGQDKVDRMVRLSKINMLLINAEVSNINTGNSIIGESSIDEFIGKVDLIITNPPFGAEFEFSSLDKEKFPILAKIADKKTIINSELAMLDRCLTLLKPGGNLVIVLPDSVVSAKGIYEQFRSELINNYEIKSTIELPAVTFAQAGTRTKTVILYIKKSEPQLARIAMAVCNDVGYNVKEKVGVPVKVSDGNNEMLSIAKVYKDYKNNTNLSEPEILSFSPSITMVPYTSLIDNILNPSFYNADRLDTVQKLERLNTNGFEIKKLNELADFVTKKRKSYYVSDNIKHISVLHINPDGTIDFKQVENFVPVSKGRLCESGDVIFSRINPRIPRMAVVPEVDYKLVCSTEFEILRPLKGISPYFLVAALRLQSVSQQIENLTSGTSSSHNRIKTEQLEEILIPVPTDEEKMRELSSISMELQKSIEMKYKAEDHLNKKMEELEHLLFQK
ncbi:MAG: N-6 DNA methylase [Bacillota bacterium]|jgi:type I restriction-modification system DNA methylase subunit